MKNTFFLIIGLAIILGSLFLFFQQAGKGPSSPRSSDEKGPTLNSDSQGRTLGSQNIKINGKSIEVEIADTQEARVKGLSSRETLEDGSGMLFVFENPGHHGIWMKDMNFAIDIIWIDENLKVLGVVKQASPESFPEVFYPPAPILYVLELPAGTFDALGIKIGDILNLGTEMTRNQ